MLRRTATSSFGMLLRPMFKIQPAPVRPARCASSSMGSGYTEAPQTTKLYTSYKVYKGNAALEFEPAQRKFEDRAGYVQLKQPGVSFISMANSQANDPNGRYAWSQKVLFSMKVEHMGAAKDWTIKDPPLMFQFTNKAGELSVLNFEAASPTAAKLSIQQGLPGNTRSIAVEVTVGELKVLQTLMEYSIPHLLAWDIFFLQES